MRVGIWSNYEQFNDDAVFFSSDSYKLSEGLEKPFQELKLLFETNGHTFEVLKPDHLREFDAAVFLDFPAQSPHLVTSLKALAIPAYLVILESEIVHPANWNAANYDNFETIFTWSTLPSLGEKVVYSPIPQYFSPVGEVAFEEKKLLCLISGNKTATDKRELYTARRKAARWLERNHPHNFDLYGFGWEKGGPQDSWFWLPDGPFPSYRGSIANKRQTLSQYKFSLCFENVQGIPGYLTEKLFDCLFSASVPIYWGAPDVAALVPRGCYLLFSDYRNLKELYEHLTEMTAAEYATLLANQKRFLGSPEARPYSAQGFSERLFQHIAGK